MGVNLNYLDKLDEKIYYGSNNSLDFSKESINNFFSEMIERKRDIPVEGGFQLAGVLKNDCFALKSCSNDGDGSHHPTLVNLLRYLDGFDTYLDDDSVGYSEVFCYYSESIKDSMELRFVCTDKELTFGVSNYSSNPSEFQLDILTYITIVVSNLFDNNIISCDIFTIGLDFSNFRNVIQEVGWNSSSRDRCLNYINSFRNKDKIKSVR